MFRPISTFSVSLHCVSFFCNPSGLDSGACIQSYREGGDACARINKGHGTFSSTRSIILAFIKNSGIFPLKQRREIRLSDVYSKVGFLKSLFLLDIDLLGETPVEETFR